MIYQRLFLFFTFLHSIYYVHSSIISDSTNIATTTTKSCNYKNNIDNRLNNTKLLTDTARKLDILPPWNAPSFVWKWAWNIHKFMMPYLHYFDTAKAKDSYVNLAVLWWKAISGNCYGSKLFDNGVAFDLLPSFTRNVVKFPLCWLYPRLHHQNVALRTLYLDELLSMELTKSTMHNHNTNSCLASNHNDTYLSNANHTVSSSNSSSSISRYQVITIGAGFDTRSLRFQSRYVLNNNIDFYEIDLPEVIEQKQSMFIRYLSRRKKQYSFAISNLWNNIFQTKQRIIDKDKIAIPCLFKADLNELQQVQQCLESIIQQHNIKDNNDYKYDKTIFIVEAVLMYLKDENVLPLLDICMKTSKKISKEVSFCFADRFPTIPIDKDESYASYLKERDDVSNYLKQVNLDLGQWLSKPGKARHMGVARLKIK